MDQKASLDAYRKKENIVPAVVYQTWHTKDFHPVWTEQFRIMKEMNKHITFHLFTDDECREYIKNNFEFNVLWAYDRLNPTAYKADLWRYCVLYKEGGIYLDIKLLCYELDLLRKEDFLRVKDMSYLPNDITDIYTYENESYDKTKYCCGIWQAVMATTPNSTILKNMIDKIVFNVSTQYFGPTTLSITGPHALDMIDKKKTGESNFSLCQPEDMHNMIIVRFNIYPIVSMILGYRKYANYNFKKGLDHNKLHYSHMWLHRNVYNTKHPDAYTGNVIGYRGKSNNITSVCPIGDGLFLIESFDNATNVDNGKVSTSQLKTHISIYDNRIGSSQRLPTPDSLIKNRVIGCMDPQFVNDYIMTFNTYINDDVYTIVIPGSENIKNTYTWTNLKGSYSLFVDSIGNKIAMHIRRPNIEFYKLDASNSPIKLGNPVSTININCFIESIDWISHGIKIAGSVWFLMRRTKYNKLNNYYTASNAYSWLLVDADKYTINKISCAFTFNESNYSKISNLSYDFRSKAITIIMTSLDSLPQSKSYDLHSIESGLIWHTL